MNRMSLIVLSLTAVVLVTPLVSAASVYPKNNDNFEKFSTIVSMNFRNFINANYAATAGIDNAQRLIVSYVETPVRYQIFIGEAGPEQRVYNLYNPTTNTGDFKYSGIATVTYYDPVLPYEFKNTLATLFIQSARQHFRVDYTFDFSSVPGGLDGTITMLALVTGNDLFLSNDKPMTITSIGGTGDFADVQIHATSIAGGPHSGVVLGWPK